MEAKISLKKAQFLVNIAFSITFIVWITFDVLKIIPSPLAPATHILFFEGVAMLLLGMLFGTVHKEPWWIFMVIILTPVIIYGVLFRRGLFTVLAINAYLFGLFLCGHFLQRNRKIIEVEKA